MFQLRLSPSGAAGSRSGCKGSVKLTILLAVAPAVLPTAAVAADFGFSVVIRAGGGTGVGRWELGIGASGSTTVRASINPYWVNGALYDFSIGYMRSTNTAFLEFRNQDGSLTRLTYQPAGGAAPAPAVLWEFPAQDFYVRAERRNRSTSIRVDNFTTSGALSVIQSLSSQTLYAAQDRSATVTSTLAMPVVFQAPNGAGDWLLSGRIRLTGTAPTGNVSGDNLIYGFTGYGTRVAQVPEPPTWTLLAGGMGLAGAARSRWRRKGSG